MRLTFEGKTNRDYCMVNTAVFQLKDGGTVTVDRASTEWSVIDGILHMTWSECYIWGINGFNVFDFSVYPNDEVLELFSEARLLKLELEEDADEDYNVTDVTFVIW